MELVISTRDAKKSAKSLRAAGSLPAVVYGRSQAATPIAVDRKEFEKVFRSGGESTVITLTGPLGEQEALIHQVDFDPVSGVPVHADFYAIQKGQTVTVSVPLQFEGISPAVKDKGGILVKVMHELEIEVAPKDLPHAIAVDISALENIDDKVLVSDLKLPASATVSAEEDEVVAMVSQAVEEPVEAPVMDISQIETSVERGKKEEEAPAETE